jgi:cobalt-zinc-cadmium resistance protein CzcA
MPTTIIRAALENRLLVIVGALLAAALGVVVMLRLPIDAFPDLTNNQVVVVTECPAMPPLEVESRVTFPIESAMMGLPKTQQIRSTSKLGLSMVTVIFDDSVNTYFARQLVNERVQEVRTRLPGGLEPSLGPVATAFGEVLQYTVEGKNSTLMERKTMHDWTVRFQLRSVAGVNEVNSWGGDSKQYVIEVDPDALQRYGLTLRDLFQRVQMNNENFGGGFIQHEDQQYTVFGSGRVATFPELEKIVLLARAGVPVLLRDVAVVREGAMPRQGAVMRDGKGETVSGMVIALKGANGLDVIEKAKEKIAALHLPDGMRLVPFYDQSEVIFGTIHTVRKNLLEAGCLVVIVLVLFLGNLRAAFLVTLVIPLSLLFGFMGMAIFGVSANLMSLGAIDFGMIVDGAVVMVENSVRRIGDRSGRPVRQTILEAALEVGRPITFGVAIIIAVYLPIMTLEGLEGRMFSPMAITVCSALVGALLLSLTLVPVLGSYVLRPSDREDHSHWFEVIQHHYGEVLGYAMRHAAKVVALSVILLAIALGSLRYIGTEFMPRLDEGSILVQTRKLPGISLPESVAISTRVEKAVLEFPEVSGVVTKLGRPDVATEAMGVYEADVYVLLKPKEQWRKGVNKEALISQMDARLGKMPGLVCNFTQPMAMRLDEVVSGIKADVAVKIFGPDLQTLEKLADSALKILSRVPGAADSQAEILSGIPELRVSIDRAALARYGLDVRDVRDLVDSTTGGTQVSELVENERKFPIVVRLPQSYRNDLRALAELQLQSSAGERVRLNQVASLTIEQGPEVVNRESAQRRIVVQSNVRGRDLGSFVAEAQTRIKANLNIPAGYTIEWGGQFENQQRATRRLTIVLPLSIVIIFGLLYATFGSSKQAVLIFSAVPFALVGGIAALWMRGLTLNLSAMVGFIALFGVAVLNGIVMVSCINQLILDGRPMLDAVREGALLRLRPVMMTAMVASLGFIPMALSQSAGAEIQRPLATVVIGGLFSSTMLTLLVLPVVFPWFGGPSPIPQAVAGGEADPIDKGAVKPSGGNA